MRNLYLAISLVLLTASELANADAKVEAINDVTLTPCLTTRVTFNQDVLKSYQAGELSLKIEDEAEGNSLVEPISAKNGVFSWEKAIPVGENLTFTLLKDNNPISYAFSKSTNSLLTKIVAPTQVAEAETDESVFVRGIGKDTSQKEVPVTLTKDQLNKELLVIVTSEYGKLLWQHYGKFDGNLVAKVPSESSVSKPRIIVSDTVCKK